MTGAGGVLSFEVEGSGTDACRVAEALNLFTLAPSLGGVDSLVTIPVLTSHYLIDPELLKKMGVTEQMIRLSVGVEHVEDLIADLEKGLAVLSRKRDQVGVAGLKVAVYIIQKFCLDQKILASCEARIFSCAGLWVEVVGD